MRTFTRLAGALLVGITLCMPSALQASQKHHTLLTDGQIRAAVEHKVSELDLGTSQVSVTVKDGVVSLSGTVPSVWLKQELIDRARQADDVTAVVSDVSVMKAENDEVLATEVANKVRRYVFYTIYDDVEGRVHDGVVTLTGKVTAPYKATEMADLAARVPGVQQVDNHITTLPLSTFDDQLRATIASRIYRDPLFWNYAIQPNPPVHIVVENGHVTLTGVVNSEVERRQAETIARTTFGSFSIENQLRLDSDGRPSTH